MADEQELPRPYPVQRVGDRWEVQVWMDCGEGEGEVRAIAMTPQLMFQYRENLRSDLEFADDLEKSGKALAKHGIDSLTSRLFLKKAAELRNALRSATVQ